MILLDQNTLKGGVFALGNFDSVHRGHRLLLSAAVAQARMMGVPARVLTFEPHPRQIFQPTSVPFRLTPPVVKARLIKNIGIDDVVVCDFTHEFAQISAQNFVEKILIEKLGAQFIVAGQDFTFGHNREGTMQKLAAWLRPRKIGIQEIALVTDDTKNSQIYSSTRVRDFLQQGQPEKATEILGRSWSITGTIIKGDQRGRSIGVPTANIMLNDTLRPKFGVYAVQAGHAGKMLMYRGVANIGTRPTVDGKTVNLEAHLFNFNDDIYGQEWEFALTRFIRPEQKFGNIDELKAQITKDIEAAT